MNPAGQTPVMADPDKNLLLVDSMAICEYFEETVEKSSIISGTAANRAEIRRLVSWFDTQFYGDLVAPLLNERMRSEERREGKECVSTCRSRRGPSHQKKKK